MIHPPYEQAETLTRLPGIRHGFFGRRSGNSGGDATLNTSDAFDDDADRVAHNRRLALTAIGAGPLPLAGLKQVHSADVVTLGTTPDPAARPEADGVVTAIRGSALGILTADCTPVLFADAEAGVIGACHAGWRGAVGGIVGNTLAAMQALGATPARINAAIGPTISGPNYEVGPDFTEQLLAVDADAAPFVFTPEGADRAHFDLPGYVLHLIERAGISRATQAGGCTFAQPARYFSHRYSSRTGAPAGRQIAIIAVE